MCKNRQVKIWMEIEKLLSPGGHNKLFKRIQRFICSGMCIRLFDKKLRNRGKGKCLWGTDKSSFTDTIIILFFVTILFHRRNTIIWVLNVRYFMYKAPVNNINLKDIVIITIPNILFTQFYWNKLFVRIKKPQPFGLLL